MLDNIQANLPAEDKQFNAQEENKNEGDHIITF